MMTRSFLPFMLALVFAAGCGDDDRPLEDAGDLSDAFDDAIDAHDAHDADDASLDVMIDIDASGDAMADAESDAPADVPLDAFDAGPGCGDGLRNGDETDVDCGGPTCFDRCDDGSACAVSSDCSSAVCIGAICQPARCSDGIRNGLETGPDCGGGTCPGCDLGEGCVDGDDCAAGECVGGFCVADHCFDDLRNVNETDVDCGGPDCGPCGVGLRCAMDGDCLMGTCITGFCRTAACTNGVMDPGEAGVDCGGECPGCADGSSCTMDDDCLSRRCEGTTCTSCEDDLQNGDETDIDCGGSCDGCFGGESCITGADCSSGTCNAGVCEGGSVFYEEDFATGDGGWTAGGTASSWEYGTPSTTNIMGAFTGTQVWVTNADGNYNVSETSWVESPSFDLSGVTMDPVIELAVNWETESCCDEVWLELSTDGGRTWTKVGAQGDAWYNDTSDVWAGSSGGWRMVGTELTGAAGFADVRIRIFFDADFSVQDEGFAFDDVVVREELCNNGMLDASEADVDCGGECAACTDGSMCVMPGDCESMLCEAGACISCLDGIQNGDELAIDCGGPTCGGCPGGTPCTDDSLCASGECDAGSGTCTATPFFYDEDFEGGPAWTASGGSWEHGVPNGSVIDSAASGINAWVTNLDGDYMNGEDDYIESPRIDLGAATSDPVLTFSLNYVTEGCCDEGWVEVSTNDGMSWTKLLGTAGSIGWYNDTFNQWWDGGTGGWNTVSTVLTGTARQSRVRLRIHFRSDFSVVREGFGIDDVRIARAAPNLAVQVTPSADRCDAATVRVTNVGSAPVGFFDLITNADGVMDTMRVMTALDPGESYETEVVAALTLEASVSAAADPDPSNDTDSIGIAPPIDLSTRYVETFEADGGGWLVNGTNASWEHGEPNDTFISNADSGMGAWVTDLNADHPDDESSFLTSPCFDASSVIADVNLGFSRIFDLEPTNDHVHVEYSIDGGRTWAKLGAFGEGTNWYNDLLGDFWDGVSGAAGEWRRADIDVPGSAGSVMRVRFVMQSNGSINEEGFGLDDVIITP